MDLTVTNDIKTELAEATKSGDPAQIDTALIKMADALQEKIIGMAKTATDTEVARLRGGAVLTAEENEYYAAVIDNEGFAGIDKEMPPTVINLVFKNLTRDHALLNAIGIINTGAVTKWIMRTGDTPMAAWGELCAPITKEILDEMRTIDTFKYKLSAFMPVCKAMLDLGPQWLHTYVVTLLTEALKNGVEQAVIDGDGADKPIGMTRDLDAGTTSNGITTYDRKTPIALTELTPKTLGKQVMAPLTDDGKRAVDNVLLVVHPEDYWSAIFPATAHLTSSGAWATNVWPIPVTVVQSPYMTKGQMAAGVSSDYFMTLSNQLGMGKVQHSDEYHFLEDNRVYLAKLYGYGQPKNNTAFMLFDISALTA